MRPYVVYGCTVLSGILSIGAVMTLNLYIGMICLLPLLFVSDNISSKKAGFTGFLLGITIAICAFYWMIDVSTRFTGGQWFYGVVSTVLSSMLFAACYIPVLWLFAKYRANEKVLKATCFNALLLSSLFFIAEDIRYYLLPGFPLFAFHIGSAAWQNIVAIQHVSYAGHGILTLFIITVNYFIFDIIRTRNRSILLVLSAIVVIFFSSGYWLYRNAIPQSTKGKSIPVALASYNILPEVQWNRDNGDSLANIYIRLNRDAIKTAPALIIWPESSIPWSYTPEDDLAKTLLRESRSAGIYELIGLNIPVKDDAGVIHNAAALFFPDGHVKTYYKNQLLTLIETPLPLLPQAMIPFTGSDMSIVAGTQTTPLTSPLGSMGVFICNESVLPSYQVARQNADFFVNISNDGWFSDSYVCKQHFFNARVRAVEARKDICINSNCGYTGAINAAGEILVMAKDKDPHVYNATIHTNNRKTLAVSYPDWLLYLSVIYTIIIIVNKQRKSNQTK